MYERHGASGTRLHNIWRGMRDRCYRTTHDSYMYYGGRGITICPDWLDSFSAFQRWALATGYRSDKSIDRKDGNKNYEPDNCRWSTDKQQANNKGVATSHLMVAFDGKTVNLLEASRLSGVGYTTLVRRYKKGLTGAALFKTNWYKRNAVKEEAVKQMKNGNAKLTKELVDQVKSSPLSGLKAAKLYQVSPALISMIRSGQRRA